MKETMKNMNIMKRSFVVGSLLKRSMPAFILLWAGLAFSTDFNMDFNRRYQERAAEGSFSAKKYPEAREAFEKLAATAKDPLEKAMWQARIAAAVGLQKDKLEEGLALAKAIGDKPYSLYAQMEIMFAACDYKGIVSGFGTEDIAAWPPRRLAIVSIWTSNGSATKDEEVRCMALYYRGYAYYKTGSGESAEKDLEKAAELINTDNLKVDILSALADLEGQLLKNKEKALAVNMKITYIRGGYSPSFIFSFFHAADYLREQKRYDDSLDVLNRLGARGVAWQQDKYIAIGKTLVEAGRLEEAIAAYRQSCDDKFKDNAGISDARLALGDTLAKAGKTEEAIAVYNTLIASEKCRADIKAKAKTALEKLGKPAK